MTDLQKTYVTNIIDIAKDIYQINDDIEPIVIEYVQSLDLTDPMTLHAPVIILADNLIQKLKLKTNDDMRKMWIQ